MIDIGEHEVILVGKTKNRISFRIERRAKGENETHEGTLLRVDCFSPSFTFSLNLEDRSLLALVIVVDSGEMVEIPDELGVLSFATFKVESGPSIDVVLYVIERSRVVSGRAQNRGKVKSSQHQRFLDSCSLQRLRSP